MALRSRKATRHIPLLFVGRRARRRSPRIRAVLPDAAYTTWGRMRTAIPAAIRTAPAAPFVPPDALYAGRTLVQKLGIAAGERVAVVGAPPGFAALLGAAAAKARADRRATTPRPTACSGSCARRPSCGWRVATPGGDARHAGGVAGLAEEGVGRAHRLDGNVVRETRAWPAGLVDFKVCSVDATWSGLAFKRKKR